MKVLISVPNGGQIHKAVVGRLLLLQRDDRYELEFSMPVYKPYENNLHHLVKEFLKGDYHYWLSIDSDNPPKRNPLDLVELDLDLVGLPTPFWQPKEGKNIFLNGFDYVVEKDTYAEHLPQKGLQQVDAVGTGCFIAARRVFEDKELQKGAFIRKLNSDGTVRRGTDISFCERVRTRGFKIWCHYDYQCQHFKNLDLGEIVMAYESNIKSVR